MRCINCGGETAEGENYCATCARKVAPNQPKNSADGKKSGGSRKMLAIIIGIIILFVAVGGGLYSSMPISVFSGSALGKAEVKLPAQADVIMTSEYGMVPVNQVMIVVKDGLTKNDAQKVASTLGGKVVGYFDYINLYQIEIGSKTEPELKQAITLAKQQTGVELAFPNQEITLDVKLIGVQVSALDDPVYGGDKGKGYDIVGVQRAWNLIKAAKIDLQDVKVGVVDDGLFKPTGEFDGESEVSGDTLANPTTESDPKGDPYGSHGTAVTNIIAANPQNGGIAGIASGPLGSKLKVEEVNHFAPPYGDSWVAPDPNDPTKVTYSHGHTQMLGSLVALKKSIDSGCKTINCSWGATDTYPETAAAYKKFFEKMAKDHPDVIFVCSAGNNGKVVDGSKRYPSGLNLPNMITVGNVMNDGTNTASSNMSSANYEVTLAAPGEQSIHGLSEKGELTNDNGGTSMATPHVTATIALMRSINPNLTAEQIKNILKETASKGVTVGDHSNLAPPQLGAGILSVDQAVLAAINELRKSKGLPELSYEDALASINIDLVAESDAKSLKDWKITATLPAILAQGGTDAKIELQGGGAIGGNSSIHVDKSGAAADWSVTLQNDTGTVLVTRADTDSKWKVDLGPDLSGNWNGNGVFERVLESIPYEKKSLTDSKECEGIDIIAALKKIKGKSFGIQLNVAERKDPKQPYQATLTISNDGKPGNPYPIILGYDNPDVYFEINERQFKMRFDGQAKGNQISGQYSMKVVAPEGELEFVGGPWSVTKQ